MKPGEGGANYALVGTMKFSDIAQLRLQNQRLDGKKFKKPEEVVAHFGAMQAQDYLGALWAIGLRSRVPLTTNRRHKKRQRRRKKVRWKKQRARKSTATCV